MASRSLGRTLLHLRHFCSSNTRRCLPYSVQRRFDYSMYDRTCNIYLYQRYFSTLNGETKEGKERHIHLSDQCVQQLKKITTDENEKNKVLRVFVEGGGCSGFQYLFKLDTKIEDDDRVFEREGVKVVIDRTSLDIIDGSTIDYKEELIKSAFAVVDNPNAEMGCSCGVSFSLKM